MTEDELNAIKSRLEIDIQSNNGQHDPAFYISLNELIGDGHDKEEEEEELSISPNTRQIMEGIFDDHDAKHRKRNSMMEMQALRDSLRSNFKRHGHGSGASPIKPIHRSYSVNHLEKRMTIRRLENGLGRRRMSKETLIQRSILREDGGAEDLKVHRREIRDRLTRGMRARTDVDALAGRGILQNKAVAPTLQATATKLEKQQKSDKLRAGLDSRSSASDLQFGGNGRCTLSLSLFREM